VGISRTAAVLLFEGHKLQDQIVGVLAGELGVERVAAGGVGAVTVDAGGDALTRDTSTGNRLAAFDRQRGVLGREGRCWLLQAGIVVRQLAHLFLTETSGEVNLMPCLTM
jgi:hypothetical protein